MAGAERGLALVAGVGEGLGVAIAGAFAEAGRDVLGLARSEKAGGSARAAVEAQGRAYAHACCDLADAGAVDAALAGRADRVEVTVYAAHMLLIRPFEETAPEAFEAVWRAGCFGAANVARAVLPGMAARGRGTAIFTGATAGVRGGARFSAFASAKFALRGMAQSLAREYGPRGVHVAHVVLDGLIDAPQTEARFGAAEGAAARMKPEAIARAYVELAAQDRTAWSQELDLRPFSERF